MPIYSNHILLVDDNRTDAELTTLAIRKVHPMVHISWVSSGAEALDFIQKFQGTAHQIDLLILDLMMPEMDGLEVLKELNERELKHFPVVIYSGSKSQEHEEEMRQLRVDDYFRKPFDYFSNLRLFETICGRWLCKEELV